MSMHVLSQEKVWKELLLGVIGEQLQESVAEGEKNVFSLQSAHIALEGSAEIVCPRLSVKWIDFPAL